MEFKQKLSDLSTIPIWAIDKFDDYMKLVYSNDIVSKRKEKEQIIELDIFEGKLYIKLEDDNVKYKFIPSKEFDKVVRDSIIKKENKLLTAVSQKLKQALVTTYKDIL